MSLSWHQRKSRLSTLLNGNGNEDADGIALDRLLHGQTVIGKSSKTAELDELRFQDKDLSVIGTLEYGQYGVIDVVNCALNGHVYVRKSIEKRFALRSRDQCFPQFERDILLQASKTRSQWAPHLLAAFQTPTHLNLVMDFAEGGTLWDVLESSPHDGRIPEVDIRWWAPQVVSAVHWCHSQGFAHRDIKPHNFVLKSDAHILLIDFGSAAPLLPPSADGTQLLPKRYCLVPCGTCDYISPEILQAHEEALVALEMDDDLDDGVLSMKTEHHDTDGYGVETDWWSMGAMLYEMAYGVAPFFANDVRQTYQRIMNHQKSLRFEHRTVHVPPDIVDFLRRLLCPAETRLGRRNIMQITDHPLFEGVDWARLHTEKHPPTLHLPQFTYAEPKNGISVPASAQAQYEDSISQGFAFSAFFQSSKASSVSPGLSIHRPTPTSVDKSKSNSLGGVLVSPSSVFIGFSWGPVIDAFPVTDAYISPSQPPSNTYLSAHKTSPFDSTSPLRPDLKSLLSTPTPRNGGGSEFFTPNRLNGYNHNNNNTLPRTSTSRRTAPRRPVSDREAMKQLVDCIGMSARKKVLESGRKPRILTVSSLSRGGTGRKGVKELRFDQTSVVPDPIPNFGSVREGEEGKGKQGMLAPLVVVNDTNRYHHNLYSGSDADGTESEGGPPSPSPSPRPGSAMSMSMSRRSGTPTVTVTLTGRSSSFGPSITGVRSKGSGSGPSTAVQESNGRGSGQEDIQRVLDDELEKMEERYGGIMREIGVIEERLAGLSIHRG